MKIKPSIAERMNRPDACAQAILDSSDYNDIPITITLNSEGGKKDQLFFTIPGIRGSELHLRSPFRYLRPPWNSLESTNSNVGLLLDEIPAAVVKRGAEREALRLQQSKTILGVWKDNEGNLFEYKADGTKNNRLKDGYESIERWAIQQAGRIECTSWQGKILTLNDTEYVVTSRRGTWKGTRVSQQVLDDARNAINKMRQKIIGRWRDEKGREFSINADGTMTGDGYEGNWSTDGTKFTSKIGYSSRVWDVISVTDASFEMKVWGRNWKCTKIR